MMRKILATRGDGAALLIRLALGVVMFPHGAQKLLGWFGGAGLAGTIPAFAQNFGVPGWLAVVVVFVEFFGSLALIFGVLTRLAAFAIGFEMVVAVALVHWQNGFFMNWYGNKAGEGFEYHILVIGIALALMVRGGGSASVDLALSGERPR